MAAIVGYAKKVSGEYFVKDTNGKTTKIKVGDPVHKGEIVYGADGNAKNSQIEIALQGGEKEVLVAGNKPVFMDTSLLRATFLADDGIVLAKNIQDNIGQSLGDVAADTQQKQSPNKNSYVPDNVQSDYQSLQSTMDSQQTQKISQRNNDENGHGDRFFGRDGAAVNVNSSLRSANFFTKDINNDFQPAAESAIRDLNFEKAISKDPFQNPDGMVTDVGADLRDSKFGAKIWDPDAKPFDTPIAYEVQDQPLITIINPVIIQSTPVVIDTPKEIVVTPATTTVANNTYTNSIPVAVNDTTVLATEGGAVVSGNVTTNDIPGGDGLVHGKELKEFTYGSTTYTFDDTHTSYTVNTALGSLTVRMNGTWELTPGGITQNTTDKFSYKIVDSNGDISNSATQPMIMLDTGSGGSITSSTPEDTSIVIALGDKGDGISINSASLAIGSFVNLTSGANVIGKLTNNGDGTVTFQPAGHYSGTLSFNYDATLSNNTTVSSSVNLTVTPTAEVRLAGITTDTNADGTADIITQGDKTYDAGTELASYGWITLAGLSVTNQDDRGVSAAVNPFGSETTTVKLSGAPVGYKFQYNDGTTDHELTVTNVNTGVTIPFEYISTLKVQPTNYDSGDIAIKMEVIAVDGASTKVSNPDTLTLHIEPKAWPVTVSTSQATGNEDAGRSHGNTYSDSSASTIDQPQNGIALNVNVTSVDTSGHDKFTVNISAIPDGGVIYYSDANGTVTVNETGILSGTNANVSAINTAGSGWQLVIANFDKTAPLKFIPPHNSNVDYTFVVNAYSKDGNSISSNSADMNISVNITGAADIPINDTFKKMDTNAQTNADSSKNIYSAVVQEDTNNTTNGVSFSLKNLYSAAGLNSYDNADGSETLSIVITGLGSNFDVSGVGVSFNGASGTAREWSFALNKLDGVTITAVKNFSGEIPFSIKHITTEDDGNSKVFSQNVTLLVTPVAEATTTSSVSVTEDMSAKVNFNVTQQNGETGETLDAVWIKKSDITGKDFKLYSDSGATTILAANGTTITDDGTYYKLTGAAMASVYIKYGTNMGSADTTDTSFAIKYTVSDSVAVTGQTLTDSKTEVSGVYNITLQSVTDTITVDASNVLGAGVAYTEPSGVKTVTINNTGSFTLDVDISGTTDTDGSEKVTRLVIEGVQRGITVDGATMGISGSKNIWFLDIPDTAINAAGAKYTVTFNVNNRISPDEDSVIKITAYAKDSGATANDIQTASTTVKFVDNMIDGGGAPVPDITASMTKTNALITEDTSFKLSSVLSVTADTVNDPNGTATYSIAFKSLSKVSFDMTATTYTVNTYNDGTNDIYVITATGGQAAINTMLNSVYLKPDLNYNINNAAGNNLTFNAVLTAYQANGYGRDTATVDFSSADNGSSVKPVTDSISSTQTLTYVDQDGNSVGSAKEDGTYTIKINLDTVDDPHYSFVQGAADATTATTISLTRSSGIYGTLVWTGGSYTFDSSHSTANIPVGCINDGSLKFTPAANVAGSVSFSYTVYAKEIGADNISSTTKSFSISVAAVADGLNLPHVGGSGGEDTYIQIYSDTTNSTPLSTATMIDSDGSESITAMFIDKVPENFLVYVGDTHQTLATKGVSTGTVTIDGASVSVYKWSIDISNGVPKVWIKAPSQWSSATDVDMSLLTTVKDGTTYATNSSDFKVSVTPVADGFSSVTATDTFQTTSADTLIRLSANAIDLDGSEKGVLTLHGFGAGATFKQDGASMAANTVYNAGSDTYTISNIDLSTAKLNKVTFEQAGLNNQTIDFTIKTVESDGSSSSVTSGTFQATTDNLLSYSGSSDAIGTANTDRMILDSGINIDFSSLSNTLTSIEKIDLTQNGNHALSNISLADITGLTDTNHDLIITGDAGDSVGFKAGDGWSGAAGAGTDAGFHLYTNSGDATVLVKVDDTITTQTIS